MDNLFCGIIAVPRPGPPGPFFADFLAGPTAAQKIMLRCTILSLTNGLGRLFLPHVALQHNNFLRTSAAGQTPTKREI
jgi:hypothetical protein